MSDFEKWYKDNEIRFHQGQFTDKDIARSAWSQLEKKNEQLKEALHEVQTFLGHIQPWVGEGAFAYIWDITEDALNQKDEN